LSGGRGRHMSRALAVAAAPLATQGRKPLASNIRSSNVPLGQNRHIRLHHANFLNKTGGPCVLYVPGFMRHSGDVEVRFVANHCLERGYECIVYDPGRPLFMAFFVGRSMAIMLRIFAEGLGHSSGNIGSVEFSAWLEDALTAAAQTSNPRLVLVSPSMGSILGLLLAKHFRDMAISKGDEGTWRRQQHQQVVSLLMVAPAISVFGDSVQRWYENELNKETRTRLEAGEVVDVETCWGIFPLRMTTLQSLTTALPDLESPDDLDVRPHARVLILHGKRDEEVPWTEGRRLADLIRGRGQVEFVLSDSGRHRMNEMEDLLLLAKLLDDLVEEAKNYDF